MGNVVLSISCVTSCCLCQFIFSLSMISFSAWHFLVVRRDGIGNGLQSFLCCHENMLSDTPTFSVVIIFFALTRLMDISSYFIGSRENIIDRFLTHIYAHCSFQSSGQTEIRCTHAKGTLRMRAASVE